MAIKSIYDLLSESNVIKNAIIPSENTPNRVGSTLIDIIDSQFQYNLPQPQITLQGDYPKIYFFDTGFDFSVNNPELFLFRYRQRRSSRRRPGTNVRKNGSWVHPATDNAAIKWNGWGYFNGNQYISQGVFANRITEWSLPTTLKPYEKIELTTFNKNMHQLEFDTSSNTIVAYDTNVLNGNYTLNSRINVSNPDKVYRICGANKRDSNNPTFTKVNTFAFAVAIDNINATPQNGLCPKIFGPLSEPFHVIWKVIGGSNATDTKMVKTVNGRFARPVRIASF